jgi:hypothetical protein
MPNCNPDYAIVITIYTFLKELGFSTDVSKTYSEK